MSGDNYKDIFEIRIPLPRGRYFIWNRHLIIGEGTPNEDLWLGGYEFVGWGHKYFGRVIGVIAQKRI